MKICVINKMYYSIHRLLVPRKERTILAAAHGPYQILMDLKDS